MTDNSVPVVLAYARTPFGRFGGALKSLSAIELASLAISETLIRAPISPDEVDMLVAGVGMIGANVLTSTRQVLLHGCGLPEALPSVTVDRACCSGMTAIGMAMRSIRCGDADVVICGGFESLSNTPFLWPRQRGIRPGPVEVVDPLMLRADFLNKSIAEYTGEEALDAGVDRAEQDEWAVSSHQRYFIAEHGGYFAKERFSVQTGNTVIDTDESPRADTSIEAIGKLDTVYGSPTVTPGNAPGLNDGAAFLVLSSAGFASERGIAPLAKLAGYTEVAGPPTSGTSTPAIAIEKLLDRADRPLDSLKRIEINEAFAATPLVSTLRLSDNDRRVADVLRARTNMCGGAVAIGHPLGASGARLAMTLISGLRKDGGGIGAAAICGGYGQGDGLLIEVG